MGSDDIALPLLEWLGGNEALPFAPVGVLTQPDRPAGRGQMVAPNAIKSWAQDRALPVFQPDKFSPAVVAEVAEMKPDLVLVMAFGHLLPESCLMVPRLGTLNLHASILPAYRGASPIQSAITEGDRETGISLMKMVRALDAGPVAAIERVPISPLDTAADVETRLAESCIPLLAGSLPRLVQGGLEFVPQVESAVTYCRKLRKSDGVLDFSQPAARLAARINGLYPWPSCQVQIGETVVRLGQADALVGPENAQPGTVLGADPEGLAVATASGVVRLRRLQRPGGRMLPAAEFLRGFPISPGTRLESHPMPRLVDRVPLR